MNQPSSPVLDSKSIQKYVIYLKQENKLYENRIFLYETDKLNDKPAVFLTPNRSLSVRRNPVLIIRQSFALKV